MLADLISLIDTEFRTRNAGYVQRIENLLARVATQNDPGCIGALLQFFNDDAEHDEILFSIIHTIERFDDATYVRAISDHLDSFFLTSPKWAVIVHMRILNSPETMAAYAEHMRSLSVDRRKVVRSVLEAVRQKNARFEMSCKALLETI